MNLDEDSVQWQKFGCWMKGHSCGVGVKERGKLLVEMSIVHTGLLR